MTARHASRLEALLIDERFDGEVYPGELMARHTTYRIGGPARFFVQADSIGALVRVIDVCAETATPWAVVGRGSNLLVSDDGFDGVVVALGRDFRTFRFDAETERMAAGAGVLLSAVVQETFHRSLSGLEFAVGTPGSMGGALRMNAGTRTDWLGSRVATLTLLTHERGLERVPGASIEWGYRTSSIPHDAVVVECELAVHPADPFAVRAKMERALTRRRDTQPMSEASCGSVFKNPEGMSAGELIEQAGMKGFAVGGARVSQKHANFIVNAGGATARDVLELMRIVQTRVYEKHGIELEPEVRLLGFE